MKILGILFSFFLLITSCLPCGDEVDCSDNTLTNISTNANHTDHQHNSESCTPFCSCSCCASSILIQAKVEHATLYIPVQTAKFSLENEILFPQEISSIFQPPRLT